MLTSIDRLNSLAKVFQKTASQPASQIATDSALPGTGQDYYEATETSLIPDNYSNQVTEPISQEDYEKYCGLYTTADGEKGYFPPETASVATKKAWIEGIKQLEANGDGGQIAALKWGIIHEQRQSEGLDAGAALNFSGDASSCQDILLKLLDEQEKVLNSGSSAGTDPQSFRDKQERFISSIQTMLNSFNTYQTN